MLCSLSCFDFVLNNPSHVKSPYNLLENCIKFLEISDWEVICEHV